MTKQTSFETATSDRTIRVPIDDPKLRSDIGILLGLRLAIVTIRENTIAKQLAGLSLAQMLLEREAASYQQNVLAKTMPLCAKAGVDLTAWATHSFDGTEAIICAPLAEIPGLIDEDGS